MNHCTFALAYQNYVKADGWNLAGYVSTPNSDDPLNNLVDTRLAKCVNQAAGATSIWKNVWAEPGTEVPALPLQVVSLLDVRRKSSFELDLSYYDNAGILQSLAYGEVTWPTSDFVQHIHVILPAVVNARGVHCYITSGAGYSQSVGGLWAGPLWIPPYGVQSPWESSIVDPGDTTRSRGGQGYARRRQRYRRTEVRLSQLPFAETFGNETNTVLDLQQIGYRVGTTETVIMFPRTRDASGAIDNQAIHRLGLYGHLTDALRIEHAGGDYFSATLRAEELL